MGSSSSNISSGSQEAENPDMTGRQPKPGDLIEMSRVGFKHWAVYIGNGFVVHFVTKGFSGSSTSSRVPLPVGQGMVLKEKLQDVVGSDEWRINNSLDKKYRPRPVNDIVKEAVKWIDVPLPYNIATNNCEHFATNMRYGKPESRQVQTVGVIGALTTGFFGALALIGLVMSPGASRS